MNPVLWMELRIRIRERKLWVVSMLFLVCMAAMSAVCIGSVTRNFNTLYQSPADIGDILIRFEAGFLMALLLILAPLAGAGRISQEREQRTLAGLLNTPLSRWSIVWGKLFSTWIFVAWLWFLGMPFFAAAYLWGGVDQAELLVLVGMILAAGVTVSTVSLGLSGFFSRTLTSYLGTGMILFFWLAAWPLIGMLAMSFWHANDAGVRRALLMLFYYHHPFAFFLARHEPGVLACSAAVWSSLILISLFLARHGLQRGLQEKP